MTESTNHAHGIAVRYTFGGGLVHRVNKTVSGIISGHEIKYGGITTVTKSFDVKKVLVPLSSRKG